MVCTTCTKDEALFNPEEEPSGLKSAQVYTFEEVDYLLSLIEYIESMVEEGLLSEGNGNARFACQLQPGLKGTPLGKVRLLWSSPI